MLPLDSKHSVQTVPLGVQDLLVDGPHARDSSNKISSKGLKQKKQVFLRLKAH